MSGPAFSQAAAEAQSRYALLLSAFRGDFSDQAGSDWTEASRSTLRAQLYANATSYLATELDFITLELESATLAAFKAIDLEADRIADIGAFEDLPEAIVVHVRDLIAELENALRIQIERDVAIVMRTLRDEALTRALRARSGAATRTQRRATGAETSGASTLVFEFTDRGGKRWPSPLHIRVLWRQALVGAFIESSGYRLVELGYDQGIIDHPQADYAYRGYVVELTDDDWPTVRAEIFHPNTDAWLRAPLPGEIISQE